jgi:hypothetical protein
MESLKQIATGQQVQWEKSKAFLSQKKKKPKPQVKEEKKKNRIDVRA